MSAPHASQTHGFLFADLRDYTRFVESHGDQAGAELLTRFRLLVRGVIARFDGAEIRTEGDSFYVVFPSASAAVNGGLAILEAAAAAGGDEAAGAIQVGVGVHAGETADTPEGYVGSAVNLAARLCSLAGPGELLVSDTVHGLTRTFLAVRFVGRGRRRLKGIAEPVFIYQVVPARAGVGSTGGSSRARERLREWPALGVTAISVPFVVLGGLVLLGILSGTGPFGQLGARSPSELLPGGSALASGAADNSGGPSPSLTAGQQELLGKLPGAINDDCAPSSAAEGSAGGSVSLHCDLPLSAGANEVWVDEFPTPEAVAGAFADAVARAGAPLGDCELTAVARDTWEVPNVQAGELLCYTDGESAWLVWTYGDDRILARARRSGGDWQRLYEWWGDTAIFLR